MEKSKVKGEMSFGKLFFRLRIKSGKGKKVAFLKRVIYALGIDPGGEL